VAEVLDVFHVELKRLGIQHRSRHGEPPVHKIELRRSSPIVPPTTTHPSARSNQVGSCAYRLDMLRSLAAVMGQ
jgi:hypothetical protein